MSLTSQQKNSEKIVRITAIVIQILGIICGVVLMVLAVLGYLIGGLIIVVGILVLIYEVIMIALSEKDTERINQSARLLTDVIINSVVGGLCIFAIVGVIATLVFLIVYADFFGWILIGVYGVLSLVLLILNSIIFIASAVTSNSTRSKINGSQAAQVAQIPTTFVMVQQPITSHPAQSVVEGGATGYPPPAYYSTTGEGGTPQYFYAYPGPAGVGYYASAVADPKLLPQKTGSEETAGEFA